MTTRSLVGLSVVGLCLLGLCLLASIGCNEIAGIKAAEDTGVCNSQLQISEDRVVGCMFRIACDPFFPPYSMSECVSMAWQDAAPAEACTAGATSCAEVDACIGRSYEPAESCGDAEGWICDDSGERAIHCSSAGGYSIDCPMFGGSCAAHASTVVPTAYACQPTAAPTCPGDAEEGQYFCDGSVRFTCIDGQPYGVDCSAISSDCIEYEDGVAYCSDRTENCSDVSTVDCEGNLIQVCDSNGYSVVFDCSIEGLDCAQDSESGAIDCLAEGCETATDCVESCDDDGTTLHFCVGGVPASLDCSDYGYDGCVDTEIKGNVPLAYCLRATGEPPHP